MTAYVGTAAGRRGSSGTACSRRAAPDAPVRWSPALPHKAKNVLREQVGHFVLIQQFLAGGAVTVGPVKDVQG